MEINPTTCMSKDRSTLFSQEEEESGWTLYFEDFLSYDTTATANNDQPNTSYSLIIKPHPCCQVSDATSSAKKLSATDSNDQLISIKKLGSFKKRRSSTNSNCKAAAAALVIDDALEDTATSPANSPKLCHLNQQFTIRKGREFTDISEQKGVNTSAGESTGDERATDLKKRGLCLVPVSSLTNYISGL